MIEASKQKVKRIFALSLMNLTRIDPRTALSGVIIIMLLSLSISCRRAVPTPDGPCLQEPATEAASSGPLRMSDWLDGLLEKIRFVESGGSGPLPASPSELCRTSTINGDNGKAGGPLQIHPCVVDNVNFHLGKKYSYADRYDLQKAKEIARLYIKLWLDKNKDEIAARIWNGGPRGWEKEATKEYWEKINQPQRAQR